MNTRQKEILYRMLSESADYFLVQDLADSVHCSEKTVRNDLKIIEDYLVEHSNAQLIRKPGLGVYLDIDDREKVRLFKEFYTENRGTNLQGDDERLIQIAYSLLMNRKPVTLKDIAAKHYINKATIKRDLHQIARWLERYHLTLVSKQRLGLIINGSEKNKRKALARMSELIYDPEYTSNFIKTQFLRHEVQLVTKELNSLQKRHSLFFSDEAFESLLIHVLLMIRRIKMKQSISLSQKEITNIQEKKEYNWTSECLKRLEKAFVIQIPKEEIVYVTLHVLGGKIRYQNDYEFRQIEKSIEENPMLMDVLNHIVNRVSNITMVAFNKDEMLINGLKIHLNSVLNRINYDLSVSNPMLHDIKKMYPYMFDMIIDVLEEMNQLFTLSIPEEEAAYITLHFQASIERINNYRKKKKVIVVCHMGIGMSQLLRTKLERKFYQLHVVDCVAKAELEEYLSRHGDIEIVISTIPLPKLQIPYLVVSPLLRNTDEKKVEDFIHQLDESSSNGQKEFAMLNYTTPFLVFLQEDVEHRDQIIEKLATALYEKGYVKEEYIVHTMMREKMSATSIGAGIAIPHANSKFINQSAIAIATLKKPLDWGIEKVTLVFMLAIKNEENKATRQVFHELSFISEHPSFIEKLTKETNVMKFLSYLRY